MLYPGANELKIVIKGRRAGSMQSLFIIDVSDVDKQSPGQGDMGGD